MPPPKYHPYLQFLITYKGKNNEDRLQTCFEILALLFSFFRTLKYSSLRENLADFRQTFLRNEKKKKNCTCFFTFDLNGKP